ncbi:hypothetical protein [Nonomuraea rosea]
MAADPRAAGSIQGALVSGRRAAQAVRAEAPAPARRITPGKSA